MEFGLSSVPGSGLISCLGICSLNQETMFLYLENNNSKSFCSYLFVMPNNRDVLPDSIMSHFLRHLLKFLMLCVYDPGVNVKKNVQIFLSFTLVSQHLIQESCDNKVLKFGIDTKGFFQGLLQALVQNLSGVF